MKVIVEDAKLCPGFALRLVRGVKNGPSPEWLQKRLIAIGLRPINALVDITNFITFDRGRPLHVFDAAKVKGDLTVRRARDGETLLALDGRTYTLDDKICVIADDHGVESLAGIMGGEASGCSEDTTDVLIESALWERDQHRRRPAASSASTPTRAIASSAASIRPSWCRGSNSRPSWCWNSAAARRRRAVVVGDRFGEDKVIDFPLAEVKRLAGIDVPLPEIRRILEPARLHASPGTGDDGEGRGAVLAQRHRRQGRYRRGDRAHRRRRPACR